MATQDHNNYTLDDNFSWIEKFLVWMSGHKPSDVLRNAEHPEEWRKLVFIGSSMFMAVALAAGNWFVTGYSMFDNSVRAGWVSACVGATIVMFIDRAFLYNTDTLSASTKRWVAISLFTARIGISLVISSYTAEAVVPLLLGKDMNIIGQKMGSEDLTEHNKLDPWHLQDQQKNLETQRHEVADLQTAVQQLPADIVAELNAASRCWRQYKATKQALQQDGLYNWERADLTSKRANCTEQDTSAHNAKKAYLSQAQQNLADAQTAFKASQSQFNRAQQANSQQLAGIKANAENNYTTTSSFVLEKLLAASPEARKKKMMATSIIMILEMLPYMLKMFGQSTVGRRIATKESKAQAYIAARERLEAMQIKNWVEHEMHELKMQAVLRDISDETIAKLREDAEIRQMFNESFIKSMKAFAPFESVQAMMKELERTAFDVEAFMNKFPDFAQVIGIAWAEAIKKACDALKDKQGRHHTEKDSQGH
jgi:hypothetical protein